MAKISIGVILNLEVVEEFTISLFPLEELDLTLLGLQFIPTAGHTAGSVCYYYEKEEILFTGNTLFRNTHWCVDLPTSVPTDMMRSLLKVKKIDYKILCSWYDY